MNAQTPPGHRRQNRRQKGVTLIEVLITVLIMGVGLLGLAALQALSIKANRASLQRSYATLYTHDILDSMRANRTAAVTGAYDIDFGPPPSGSGTIASTDLTRWRAALVNDLPNGSGQIAVDANGTATISVRWDESIASDVTHTFTTESSL